MCQLLNLRDITEEVRLAFGMKFTSRIRRKIVRLFPRAFSRRRNSDADCPLQNNNYVVTEKPASSQHRPVRSSDLVKVLSREGIRVTLDSSGRCDGLFFMRSQWQYCGKVFRVQKRVKRIVVDHTGRMGRCREMVILEGVRCQGVPVEGLQDCGLLCPIFWKEKWLVLVE